MDRCHNQAGWRRAWRAVAIVLLGTWVVAHLAAGSEPLHRFIHSDSDSPLHSCLVGSIGHGLVDVAATAVEPEVCPVLTHLAPATVPVPAFVPVLFQPPGRAPPHHRA